jgi:hypothetical protein
MADAQEAGSLEEQIERWRDQVRRRTAGPPGEIATLEQRLREELTGLRRIGLAEDEAFLVAAKRVGRSGPVAGDSVPQRREAIVALACAVLAGIAIKVPAFFGLDPNRDADVAVYLRNAGLLVLPCLVGYFGWKRRLAPRLLGGLAFAFAVAGVVANLAVLGGAAGFEYLTILHVPIALLPAVGMAHAGGRWGEPGARMNFIRFVGELFIYYVLIALGGGVLMAFMALTFRTIGINVGPFFGQWLVPCGAAGALVVASWLVEGKQRVMESLAPMLTRLFTPLFAIMLVAFLVTLVWSGRGIAIEREMLIGFDLLLVVVLGLVLYGISARDPQAPPGAFEVVQVVLVISALLADAVALWAIGARIREFGFSPNRVAALGENVILLVNLAWSAVLYFRFLRGRVPFQGLERWQTGYLPVYAGWAALVVLLFPPLFRWIG